MLCPVLDGVEVTKFGYKGGAATEVTVHHPRASWREQWERYVSAISEYADIASSFQLNVAIEPRPYDVVNNTERSLLLLNEASQKNVGINFDTGHLFVQKEVLEVSIEKMGQRIFLVHISDNDGRTDYHWAPGKGKIDWGSVLRAFRAIGYTGYLNIEIYGVKNVVGEYLNGRKYIENLAGPV